MIGKKINQLATELAPVSTDLTIIGDPISGVSKKITLAQLGAIFSGAVSFYTNLAGFPATGDINVIYCAKDTQKLYLWSGSAYVEVFPSQALLDTYQLRSEKGVSNGYASLDSTGKVPISQLPSSIMEYKGTWNAATNTPTLANGTGDTGDVYICNVAGTVNFGAGPITFAVGDYVIYSGSIWQRSSGAVGTVTSVAASITGNAIGITGSPVTTSGTLAFAFAGTGAQYIKGDGTLATFPNTISQAEKLITEVYNSTGATLTKGTIVYINGGQGNLPTVTKALATGDSTSAQTFGVVQADITNNNNGYVVVAGKLSDLDTQAYTEGTQLYLSATTAGTWTSTKQYAPAHLVYVGIVVRSHPTQGIVEVKIMNGFEMDELHNVAAQTPSNNDGLFWEASTSLWKNKSIATILGYTPQAQLNGTGFVKASGTTITYDNSTYLTTSAAATTYLPLVLSSTANVVDINGQQFNIWGSAGGFTSGRIIVDPVFSAIGYQNAGVFDGLKILTNGNAEFSNSGVTRFFNQVRFDSTLTNGTYTYTLPGATGTIALTSDLTGGTVTSVGLSSATSGVTIGSTPITTSGTITLAIATASGSQQGLLSSTDWTTFNNKQNALTNPVTGTGTTNYLPKFTGTSTIGNSTIQDNTSSIVYTFSSNPVLNITDGTRSSFFGTATSAGAYVNASQVGDAFIRANNGIVFSGANGTGGELRLTSTGNLGLGVTPSAWSNNGNLDLQDVYLSLSSQGAYGGTISNNAYYNAGWKYKGANYATQYQTLAGEHRWLTAGVGAAAGNAISFTQAMTLGTNSGLSIGTTTAASANGLLVAGLVSTDNSFRINGNGAVPTSSALQIGTNGVGTRLLYNVPTGAEHNFNVNGNISVFITGTQFGSNVAFSGTSATFSSSVTAGTDIFLNYDYAIRFKNSSGTYRQILAYANDTYLDARDGGIIFRTGTSDANTAERMRITSGGLVGIGRTPVNARLEVQSLSGAGSVTEGIRLVHPSAAQSGNGTGIIIQDASQNLASIWAQSTNASSTTSKLFFGASTTGFNAQMTIQSDGSVGIGTTSPDNASGYATMTINGSTGGQITFATANSKKGYLYNNATNMFIGAESGALIFDAGAIERMRITSGGNVGIGTSSVNDKFVVVGGANIWTGRFDGSSTSSQSYGIVINAGTNSNDSSLLVRNHNGSSTYLNIRGDGQATFSGDVKVKTLEVTNATTYGSSAGISTYMQITVNGNNYVIPLHGTP